MASKSFPNKRQKPQKNAPPIPPKKNAPPIPPKKNAPPIPPEHQISNRSDKARKNQDPSPATHSGPAFGEQRKNDHHPWGSVPMQHRLFHNFDAPTKNSPLVARKNLAQPPQVEIPSYPPSRPRLSSVFPPKDKTTAAGVESSPIAIPQQDKIATVGSPTSVSSSSSNERSAERKSRRHQLRKLPKPTRVKERGGGAGTRPGHRRGSDSSSVEAMEEMSYHSYASATLPYPVPMGIYPPLVASPPIFMYPANYQLLPPQPELHSWMGNDDADEQSSLKEIKEDAREDDIKGFDDFVMY